MLLSQLAEKKTRLRFFIYIIFYFILFQLKLILFQVTEVFL